MNEDEVAEYTKYILDNIQAQTKPLTQADYAEIKKWMRIAELFPDGVQHYIPKYRKFYDRYHIAIFSMDFDIIHRLHLEVIKELEVEPINDKDFEFVGKGVIETISRMNNEEKEI